MAQKEDNSVTLFRQYLQIRTDHPSPKYGEAIVFLEKLSKDIGLTTFTVSKDAAHPILVSTWEGTDPSLPSLLLNSHTDVVPAVTEKWDLKPFDAEKDANGNIFARGTQDMKCVTIQFLEAIRKMKAAGTRLKRTIHLTFVPDEEIGGEFGMAWFVHTDEFNKLNVGACLDEGLASPNETFTVFYGERSPNWVVIKATGNTGHGSRFIEDTATGKLMSTVHDMLEYREKMYNHLKHDHHECGKPLALGDVVSLNLTMLKAGLDQNLKYSPNVVPTEAEAAFDIRVPPQETEKVDALLKGWVTDRGLEFTQVNNRVANVVTPITPDSVWWSTFKGALESYSPPLKTETQIFPASTDSRFIRAKNIPAFGFSPINNTPILLHDHNEFLNEKVFLDGIDIFVTLITAMANVPPPQ